MRPTGLFTTISLFSLAAFACTVQQPRGPQTPADPPPSNVTDSGTSPADASPAPSPCGRACYGGWICSEQSRRCEPPSSAFDGGIEVTPPVSGPGAVTADGGIVDRLRFGVYGDVRPDDLNDDSHYPRDIISDIMTAFQQKSAQFVVATGDYMFSNNATSAAAQTLSLKMAEANYAGFVGHALGNHECKGWSASNCPSVTDSAQMQAFMRDLAPHSTTPYFDFSVETNLGSAKFIFIAGNAWSQAQADWLTAALNRPTTYTFVLRHHPPSFGDEVTGVGESERILRGRAITLKMYGHVHEYRRTSANEVICGNGGGPLRGFNFYGYLVVDQLVDGNVQVTSHKRDGNAIVDQWRITPAGDRAD